MTKDNISAKHEGMIVTGLSKCSDIIIFISEDPLEKKAHIFVEHLALSLRELSFYIDKYFKNNLTDKDNKQMEAVKDIRDAICHRSSSKNLLNPHIYLSGGFNFKNDDIEVQYGKTKIPLRGGLVELYLSFRKIITDSELFTFMKRGNYWNVEEQNLQKAINSLSASLNSDTITKRIKEEF